MRAVRAQTYSCYPEILQRIADVTDRYKRGALQMEWWPQAAAAVASELEQVKQGCKTDGVSADRQRPAKPELQIQPVHQAHASSRRSYLNQPYPPAQN